MIIAHNIKNNELSTNFHTNSSGLSQVEVLQLRQQYGENRLPAERGTTVWTILLNQIKSPLVYIILVAAGVSLAVSEYNDFAIIMAGVVLYLLRGFIQEYQD